MHIIVAIHGILTSQTRKSWVDEFAHFVFLHFRGTTVIKREYWAGPVPPLNVLIRNPRHTRGLVAELADYAAEGAQISFFAHSNGSDIALRSIKRLAKLGYPTRAMVLSGAAISSDLRSNGVLQLVEDGNLGLAIAHCTENDAALAIPWIWPYGRLGREGWRVNKKPAGKGDFIRDRWWPGVGHTGYFHEGNRDILFREAVHACTFAEVHPFYAKRFKAASGGKVAIITRRHS